MLRALILDKTAGALSVQLCRALARRGYEVDIFGTAGSPAFRSRCCTRALEAPPWHPKGVASALQRIVDENTYDVIYLCSEEVLAIVKDIATTPNWKALPLSDASTITTLLSKHATLRRVAEAGIRAPATIVPERESEIIPAAHHLRLPLLIKGERGDGGRHVRIVNSYSEVLSTYRTIATYEQAYNGRPALQEIIKGQAFSVGGLFCAGHALRICAHRKLLTYPSAGGLTVKGITERPAELLEAALKVFAALSYTGLGHVEFIRDERDEHYAFIEVNPRVWGSIGIAEHAGVELYMPYQALARGLPVNSDLQYSQGVVYHRLSAEIRLIAQRPVRFIGFVKDAIDPRVRSDFEWLDPSPFLAGALRGGMFGGRLQKN